MIAMTPTPRIRAAALGFALAALLAGCASERGVVTQDSIAAAAQQPDIQCLEVRGADNFEIA